MLNKKRLLIMSLCVCGLSGCVGLDGSNSAGYEAYNTPAMQPYFPGNNGEGMNDYRVRPEKTVIVPDSYHVGTSISPVSFKDRDRSWVKSQNPQGYTIELANGEKASQVAGKLAKAPKRDRMAEIQYQQGGKVYYKGLYGSYDTYEAAQAALKELPDEVKQGAGIQNWGSVQSSYSPSY